MFESPKSAILTKNLSRHFGHVKAVNNVFLEVYPGGIYAVLGPNGAGKTTLIRMLATLLIPSTGSAKIFGYDILSQKREVRGLISLTGQFASVDDDITGLENLVLLSRLLGYSSSQARARATELLEGFGLLEAARRRVKTYSGGMRKRLDIAASIIVRPKLLFLDEPTTGLDPRSRNQVWEVVRDLVDAGTTVLLTTQYLEEADQLASQIAVIDQGRIIAQGTPASLKASVGQNVLRLQVLDADQNKLARKLLNNIPDIEVQASGSSDFSVLIASAKNAVEIIKELLSAGINVDNFCLGQPSLDEVFLSITGKTTEPGEDGK
jgi:ABC-2 type transport system ATP-binding protein